jgi:hypothetical protein
MPCNPKHSMVEAAVCTLIKEIISTFEARRRRRACRRRACGRPPCEARAHGVQP